MAGFVGSLRSVLMGSLGTVASEVLTLTDAFTWTGANIFSGTFGLSGTVTDSATTTKTGTFNASGATVTLPAGDAAFTSAVTLGLNALRVAHYQATFATTGAGASPIVMTGTALPNHAIVIGGALRVNTAPTVSTNWAIQVEGANDLVTSAAISGSPWSTAATSRVVIPVIQTATTWITTTTGTRVPNIVYTGSAPGAYDIEVWLIYLVATA